MNLEQLSRKITICVRSYDKLILVDSVGIRLDFPKNMPSKPPMISVSACCYYLADNEPSNLIYRDDSPHKYFEVNCSQDFDSQNEFDFSAFFKRFDDSLKKSVDKLLTKNLLTKNLDISIKPKE